MPNRMKDLCRTLFNPILILFLFCQAEPTMAQNEFCGYDFALEQRLLDNPDLLQGIDKDRKMLKDKMVSNRDIAGVRSMDLYTIPVVIHIMHLGESEGTGSNISELQAVSAITALNDHFRALTVGNDSNIEFCLAAQDPDGNFTTGINRVDASSVCISGGACYEADGISLGEMDIAVKNLSRWPNHQYYNIWVVADISSSAVGYASFPFNITPLLDGTVVKFDAFGTEGSLDPNTAENKTLTHELGHGFGLFHTFKGDGNGTACPSNSDCLLDGDELCDTPPHIRSTLNCNETGSNACDGGSSNTLYVHNYMDYSDEACRTEFSLDQIDRMRSSIELFRAELLTSVGCQPGCDAFAADFTASVPSGPIGTTIAFTNTSTGGSNNLWVIDGETFSSTDLTHTFDVPGLYNVCLQVSGNSCVNQFCELIEIEFDDACYNESLPECESLLNGDFSQNNLEAGTSINFADWNIQSFDEVCNWGNMVSTPYFCSDLAGQNTFGLFGYGNIQESIVTENELPLVDGQSCTITFEYWVGHRSNGNLNPTLRIQAALRDVNTIYPDPDLLANWPLDIYDYDAIIAQVDLAPVQAKIMNTVCLPTDAVYSFHSQSFTYHDGDGKYLYMANVAGTGNTIVFIRNISINCCESDCNVRPSFDFEVDNCSVNFNGFNTGDPGIFDWDFGDGNGNTGPNVTHAYTAPGTYQVCLTINCEEMAEEVACQDVTITSGCGQDCLIVEILDSFCNNQGTSDPSDDYWRFDMIVTDLSGTGVNWTTSGDILDSGPYGILKEVYPDGGNVVDNPCYTFTVFDVNDPNCSTDVNVCAPAPCSRPCELEIKYEMGICNDDNTPAYISDDYYYVTLDIFGTNGQPWMAKQKFEDPISGYPDEVLLASGSGDQSVALGPILVQDGDWTMWVFFSDYYDCLIDTFIMAPEFCSGCHDVEIGNVQCYDNGTSDPNDDYWTFDLYVNGPSDYWTTQGDVIDAGPYGSTKTIHMGAVSEYDSKVNFVIVDSKDEECITEVTLNVPKDCSDECKMEANVIVGDCERGKDGNAYFQVWVEVEGTGGACWMAKKKNTDNTDEIIGTYYNDQYAYLGLFPAEVDWTLWIAICDQFDCVRDFYISAPDCERERNHDGIRSRSFTDTSIYPNPIGSEVLSLTSLSDITNVRVLDTNGRVWVNKKVAHSNYHELDVDMLPNGVYYIQLELEGDSPYIDRIIKMK